MTRAALLALINAIANETANGGNTKTRVANTFSGLWSRFFSEDGRDFPPTDPLEIGFYTPNFSNPLAPPVFTGLRIFYDNANDYHYIVFYKRDEPLFIISDEEGNSLDEFKSFSRTDIYNFIDTVVSRKDTGQEIIYTSSLFLQIINKSRLKRYKIADSAIPASGNIIFEYTHYDSFTNPEKLAVSGDTFEIFFKSKNNANVQFKCFNGDYYTPLIPILTNRHYKLTVYMYDIFGIGNNVPYAMSKIEEIIEGEIT